MIGPHVFSGLQVHDEYGYWDTTQKFVDPINDVAAQNRTHKVQILAPFSLLSKYEEIKIAQEMKKEHLLGSTLTCYNPDVAMRPWKMPIMSNVLQSY